MSTISKSSRHWSFRFGWPPSVAVVVAMAFAVAVPICAGQDAQSQIPQLVLQTGHARNVHALAFTPDEHWLASGGEDHLIYIWDVATGRIVRKLEGHTGAVNAVAFSPDGKLLASGGDHDSAILWDAGSGKMLRRFVIPSWGVKDVAFSPDGRLLAAVSGSSIALWEIPTGRLLEALTKETAGGRLLRFASDGRSIIFLDKAQLSFWNLGLGRVSRQIAIEGIDSHESLAGSPDGRLLAFVNAQDGHITVWDVASGKQISEASAAPAGLIIPLAFSTDGKILAGTYADKSTGLWDVATGRKLRSLAKGVGATTALAFSPDGRVLAMAYDSPQGSITLWDVANGSPLVELKSNVEHARRFFFYENKSKRDFWLLVRTDENTIQTWDLASGRPRRTMHDAGYLPARFHRGPGGMPLIILSHEDKTDFVDADTGSKLRTADIGPAPFNEWALNSDAGWLAYTARPDREQNRVPIKITEFSTGRELRTFVSETQDVSQLTFSKDNHWLLSTSFFDHSAFVWDLNSGERRFAFKGEDFALSPDGRWLAYHDVGPEFTLFDLLTGAKRTLQGNGSLVFSSNGRYLATGHDQPIGIWDVGTWRRILLLDKLGGVTGGKSFSPDERFLVTDTVEKPLQLWEIATGRELLPQLSRIEGPWPANTFSDDSRWLATTASDGSVRIWDLASQKPVASLYIMKEGKSWLVTTPTGFFDRSDQAVEKSITWNVGDKVYPASHLAKQRYRPGLLADIFAGREPKP